LFFVASVWFFVGFSLTHTLSARGLHHLAVYHLSPPVCFRKYYYWLIINTIV
jgi:hypothetical protein